MLNILPFCLGMLMTYYATAIVTHGVYRQTFLIGWTTFAFCSPALAYFAWMTQEKGYFPKIISLGIILISVLSSILLFDRLRFYDFVMDALLVYILFFRRVRRS